MRIPPGSRRRWRLGIGIWVGGVLLWSAVSSAVSSQSHERRTVTAQAGDVLRAQVLQLGADVVLRLRGPEGQVLQEVDRWTGDVGPERILWHVQVAGTYELEVEGPSISETSSEVPGTSDSPEVPGTSRWTWEELSARPAADAVERQVALAYADFLVAATHADKASLQDVSFRLGALGAAELALEAHYEWVNRQGSIASWAEAADGFLEVAERARQLDAPMWEVLARDALVQALMDGGDVQGALDASDRVLALCDGLQTSGWPMRRWRAISHMRRQRAFSFLGRLEDAVLAGERAETLLRRPQESHWLYDVLHQRGVLHRRSFGDARRAVADLRAALEHVPDGTDWDPARANTLDQLGAAYELLGDVDAARRAYRQSIDLDRDRRPCAEANHRARLASLEQREGRRLQERVRRMAQLRGEPMDAELMKSAQGLLDAAATQAMRSRQLVMERAAVGQDCGRDGQAVRLRLAEVAQWAGQPDESARWFKRRLDLATAQDDPLAVLESHLGLARAALDGGVLGAAEPSGGWAVDHLRRADALYQELRKKVAREELRLGLDRAARQRVNVHLALLTEGKAYDGPWTGPYVEALAMAEREMERVQRESMAGLGAPSSGGTATTDWDAVRRRLGPSDGLLYLRLGEPHSHGWWLTPEGVVYRPLPSREVLEPWIHDVRRGLADPGSHLGPRLAWLSARLLDPWQAQLQQLAEAPSPRLMVVADGVLSGLPWSALPWSASPRIDGDDEPLVERVAVVDVPYAAQLSRGSASPSGGSWMVLADPLYDDLSPLPASAAEAEAVVRLARRHGRSVELWTGPEASKPRLLSPESAEASLLHIAVHASAPTSRDGDASLWLAQRNATGTSIDGRLRARDLDELSLRADLVVLSACATGVDGWDAAVSEGQGLAKGFLEAGARQVMSSLWPISDAVTADLMSRFYMELLAGERQGTTTGGTVSAAVALRQAQRALRRREATSHPFYWAAFVVHGVDD